MKFAICRINTITGELRYRSKHSRWCKSLASALLFGDSFFASDYLDFFVHRVSGYRYEIREIFPVPSSVDVGRLDG